ncbi:hypothetical protein QBC38DRAFT_361026 [Podospora fimiseda]|uniref:Uncharacterized protein n=1 Tax=Podospora fimiseda TaxID=252190 RepID=A0AAN7BSX2_9PEZI|nr:hypothetical protein QBC38DRAFT_361026 [Podospora fimiseda]
MADYAGYYVFEQAHLAEHENDQYAGQRGYVKGTDFSLPYYSAWSRRHDSRVQLNLLRTLNCSYLSTHGVAPTLLALKQHAQSLCILIQALTPTVQIGEIGDGDPDKIIPKPAATAGAAPAPASAAVGGFTDPLTFKYNMNDAFDFLTDLTKPYANDDPSHHKPLTGLLNEIRARDEAHGNIHHCPLSETKPRAKQEAQKPYANHHNLIMHANECLERLDHEFSSTGGLLSILPTDTSYDEGNQQLAAARRSLLGQWLLYTQHLVARMHEIERSYASALDALAGEAMIPLQARSAMSNSNGRPIIYPQDRFVLANAGDDVFDHIHRVLDKREAMSRAKEEIWANNGVVGTHVWQTERGGSTHQRGLVHVDISTRFYRLVGQGRNTIFVLPAFNSHPGVEQTKLTEDQPTIVASIQPTLPKRVTELEKQFTDGQDEVKRLRRLMDSYKEQGDSKDKQIKTLSAYADQLTFTRDALLQAVDKDHYELAEDAERARRQAANAAAGAQESQVEAREAATRVAHLEQRIRELNRARARLEAQLGYFAPDDDGSGGPLALLSTITTATKPPQLPYQPTTIFLSEGSDTAYIFSSFSSLLSLNISSSLNTTSFSPEILSSTLPISAGDSYIPLLLPNNSLAIFSGNCSTPFSSRFHLFDFESKGWVSGGKVAVSAESDYAQTVPYSLSQGVGFSLQLEPRVSESEFYFFGGECGDVYSDRVLKLSSSGGDNLALGSLEGQEGGLMNGVAGFSLTELTPASKSKKGEIVTQSTGYLMLGGYMGGEKGLVDVSRVGVWNLPGEKFEWVGVKGSGKKRSGHTSVVSEDGGRVVVYGGWGEEEVGLGVLKVGVGREGWEWVDVKENKGEGKGRYGHGAVRLPGDVMMVYGGWEVGGIRGKREVEDGGLRFLDMKKMEWVEGYEMPREGGKGDNDGSGNTEGNIGGGGNGSGSGGGSGNGQGNTPGEVKEEDDGDKNKIIGLSVGLGVGLILLALAALGFCLIRRRKARRRAAREETLRSLTLGMNGSLPRGIGPDDDYMTERDDGMGFMFPWNAATAQQWYTGGDDPYSQGQRSLGLGGGGGYESLRGAVRKTGATVYMPPPPSPSSSSVLGGRPRNARGIYTPTNVNSYDFSPLGQASRNIDPIYEEADEEEEEEQQKHQPISPDKEEFGNGSGSNDVDPFLTPTTSIGGGGNNTIFPVPALIPVTFQQDPARQHWKSVTSTTNIGGGGGDTIFTVPALAPPIQQDPEVQNWKSEIDVADAVLSARIARHGSTTTMPPKLVIPPTRKKPVKLATTTTESSSESDRTNSNLSEKSAFSFVPGGEESSFQHQEASSSASANTFNTAKSHFLRGEKEEEDADYVYVPPPPPSQPGSPSKSPSRMALGTTPGNRKSWFGGLRRVFSGSESSGSNNSSLNNNNKGGEEEGVGIGGDYQGFGGLGAFSNSEGGGLLLLRRKQGKAAWEGRSGGNGGDDDWDVEKAVEQRLVQVMFTVPKERLRVVNAEVAESIVSVFEEEQQLEEGQEGVLGDVRDEEQEEEEERLRVPVPPARTVSSMTGRSSVGGGGISPSASLRTMSIRTGTLHTAEAVRLERPRTRVLAMVESIESKKGDSRDSSPAPSGKSGRSGGGVSLR